METSAKHRHARISPQKCRLVADQVRGLPVDQALELLSHAHPHAPMRHELGAVHATTIAGGSWIDRLHTGRLIRRVDVAVLSAAQRANNLAWALDRLADQAHRRWHWRGEFTLNVVTPSVILGLGLFTMLTVVALFVPLVELIVALV